jgi:hypothetical protein
MVRGEVVSWVMGVGPDGCEVLLGSLVREPDAILDCALEPIKPTLDENWMRVAPGTDAAIWRPWSRETGAA